MTNLDHLSDSDTVKAFSWVRASADDLAAMPGKRVHRVIAGPGEDEFVVVYADGTALKTTAYSGL